MSTNKYLPYLTYIYLGGLWQRAGLDKQTSRRSTSAANTTVHITSYLIVNVSPKNTYLTLSVNDYDYILTYTAPITSSHEAPRLRYIKVYDGFIGQKILKLWRQESWPFGPNLNSCSCSAGLLYNDFASNMIQKSCTGGPPLTRELLTRFPLPIFLAYVWDFSISRGLTTHHL